MALVWLLQQDFWGHVGLCAKHSLEEAASVATLYRCSEAEVGDLDVEVLVEQDVLWLQVAVGSSVRVDVVHHLEHLSEVKSADILREWSKCNIVKQFSTVNKFKDHVCDGDPISVTLDFDCIFFEFDELHHISVFEILVDSHFLSECFQGLLRVSWIGLVKHLDGDTSAIRCCCKLDFG